MTFLTPGAKLLFQWNQDSSSSVIKRWAQVLTVSYKDFESFDVTIDEVIPENADVIQIIPAYRTTIDQRPFKNLYGFSNVSETALIQNLLLTNTNFKLYYIYGLIS